MYQLQDSELIEFAKLVELTSTEILEGMHHSVRGGEGVEYHSTSPYVEGEDARRLDWKRVAATDRYFVNRFEREEKTSWSILIDGSKSMKYGEKAAWSNLWAGSLLFLVKTWGDRWRILPDLDSQFDDALERLSQNKASVKDPEHILFEGKSTERLVVLSDFFWDRDRLRSLVQQWRLEFKYVYLIQILDPKEMEFDFSGIIEFRDLESSDKLILDSGKLASKYRRALKKLQDDLSAYLGEESFAMTFQAGGAKLKDQLLNFFEAL